MALKFQLINSMFGSLTIGKNDPIGINDITQGVKRSENHEGVFFQFVLDVEFIKEGREFIKQCHEFAGGIDALVVVNVYDYDPNTYLWELYGSGQVNYQRYDVGEVDVIVTLEQTGIDRRVLNMMDIDVDAETEVSENGSALPVPETMLSEWHSKSILKEYEATATDSVEFQQLDAGTISLPASSETNIDIDMIWYAQIDNGDEKVNELEGIFTTPSGFDAYSNPFVDDRLGNAGTVEKYIDLLTHPENYDPIDPPVRNPIYVAVEKGKTDFICRLTMKPRIVATNTGGDIDVNGSGVIGFCEVYAWFEHRDADDNILLIENVGIWDVPSGIGDYETKEYQKLNLDLQVGHKLFYYCTYRVWGDYDAPVPPDGAGQVHHDLYMQIDREDSFVNIKSLTLTPPTEVKSMLIYECIQRCIQFYTNDPICFYSELTGRTDLGYAVDGDASLITISNGNWIRGRSDWRNNEKHRKLIFTLGDLLEFVNSLYCTGFGFETVDIDGKLIGTGVTGMTYGTRVFRLERREHFYRKEKIMSLGKVYGVRRRLDPKRFYNLFENGFLGKLDTKLRNATDEFNTLRRSRIPIVNTDKALKVASKMRTSGYQIELQRRLVDKTEDSNHDDELFAVSVIRIDDETPYDWRPRIMEGFAEINNVIEPETGYNYIFSPGRTRKNWYKIIASCLLKHLGDKVLHFANGTVNYRMTTRLTTETQLVEEDGSEDISGVVPYFKPYIISCENVRFTRDQMRLIRLNPYGFFELEDQFGEFMYGFVDTGKGVEHDPNRRKAVLEMLEVNNPLIN